MKQDQTIDIITATHNRGDLIGKAIISVLNQTYDNWKLTIVGDGCTDNTKQVVESFGDERISFYDKPKFDYYTKVRNWAIQRTKNELLCYRDDDGLWDRHFLEKMSAPFVSSDVVATYCGRKIFDGVKMRTIDMQNLDELEPTYYSQFKNYHGKESLTNILDVGDFMHRRSAFTRDFQGFNEDLDRIGYCSDAELFDNIEEYNPHGKIVMIPERLSYFFLNHGGKTRNMTIRKLEARERGNMTEERDWDIS